METVFDYSPTLDELAAIGMDATTLAVRHGASISDPVTANNYTVAQDDAYFDLALFFTHRNQPDEAAAYWSKIPARHQEYLLGFDFVTTE
jgi:hypothetical protein